MSTSFQQEHVRFVQGDAGSKLDENMNGGYQSSFSALSRISKIHESILLLQKTWNYLKSEDTIISVNSAIMSKQILWNIKECLRERAGRRGKEFVIMCQTLHQQI